MPHDDSHNQTFLHGLPAGHIERHHQTASIQVHGHGRTVVQHGIPAETMSAPAPELCRVNNGPIRMSMGPDGEVTSAGFARHIHTDVGTAGGSIMSTLRTGANASVELQPGNPASRTLLATAEREGLIRRTATGWEDVSTEPQSPQQVPQQAAEDGSKVEAPNGVDHEEEALWQEDIDPLPQSAFDSAAASLVNVLAHGTGSIEDTAVSLARNAGIDPALALDYVEQGVAFHERIVARSLAPMGLEGDRLQAFYESAKLQPAKLQDAIQKVVHARDVSGFRAMAVAFKASTTDLSPWKQAGFQAAVDPQTGDVLIQHGAGRWMKASDLGKGAA